MNRLIDADENREDFMERVYEILSDEPDNIKANLIIEAFDSMEVAYDVEAVVRELEAKSTSFAHKAEYEKDIGYAYVATRKYGISDGLDLAIEIVRGGRNEG